MLFNEMGMPVLDIHSRKSQAQRTRTSAEFRAGRNVIMFTSDVTARGNPLYQSYSNLMYLPYLWQAWIILT